jgi:hypothetical protein
VIRITTLSLARCQDALQPWKNNITMEFIQLNVGISVMPRRKMPRRTRRAYSNTFEEAEPVSSHNPSRRVPLLENRCIVCKDQLTLLKVRHKRALAHPLCAWLDRVGLDQLAKTSGRWF